MESASSISSAGLFFYLAATGLASSPIALCMTDFSAPINCSLSGPYLTATIQSLNSLLFVYAVRYGKAIIVVPTVNGLFPLVTIVLSLLIYQQIPTRYNLTGKVWLSLPSSSWLSMKFATLPPLAVCVKTLAARQRATSPL
jgi:hypothetical protein